MDVSLNRFQGAEAKKRPFENQLWKTWIHAVAIFAVGFLLACVLLAATDGFISTDDYYHSRVAAEIINQRTLRVDFPWLPLTILSPDQFVDHHLLYHLYLAPWAYWGGILGTKIAQALIIGAVGVAFWAVVRHLKVRYALLWVIALLGVSTPFLYRLLMIRTQAAALLFLLLALLILFQNRYRWLVPLAFGFVWLYNGFILLPAIVLLYSLSVYIAERRLLWQPLVYTLLGMGLGLVINPYFPQNIIFIVNHLGQKVDIESTIKVGSEWYPYTTSALLANSFGSLLALGIGLLAPSFRKTGRDHAETTLLLVALLTLYMLFESRRFIEYFPAFALLFCAVAVGRDIAWMNWLPDKLSQPHLKIIAPLLVVLPVLLLVITTIGSAHKDIQNAEDVAYMAGASHWLQENSEPDSIVFQTDWDDFTYLFYFNTHNDYLVGLDPTYLQLANPTLWNLWVPITEGAVERPSVLIRDRFNARYVVSDREHDAFADRADHDPNMQLVYEDDYSLIWQIVDDPANAESD